MARHPKIIGLLLATLYVSYFIGTHFFVHTHQLPTRVVVHSHPFAKQPHDHSAIELQLIDELSNYTLLVDDYHADFEAQCLGYWQFSVPMVEAVLTHAWGSPSLRAPPLRIEN